MNYSFFGTCANDHKQLLGCLKTIVAQSIKPIEIILVDSGDENIKKQIINFLKTNDIKLIYIFEKVSRVKALNIALKKSTSTYSFRFDSRTRFSINYAENALNLLEDKSLNVSVVGGVPSILPSSNNSEALICAEIMKREYIFFYPNHRKPNFNGFSSSIYLGCFRTDLLKRIKFNENKILISEDSLIINNFIERGYKAFVSSDIKVAYLSREYFKNILKLFNTYGYCRANTILMSKKLFISLRHFYVVLIFFFIFLILLNFSFLYLFLLPLILIMSNVIGEIFFRNNFRFYLPFYATLCQFSWIIGFLWSLVCIFRKKSMKSNFIS